MTPEQFAEMQATIKSTIQITVNGKIDGLRYELRDYIKDDNAWKKTSDEWKDAVTPSIEIMKKMEGFTTTGGWILKSIALVGAAATAIWGGIKFLAWITIKLK